MSWWQDKLAETREPLPRRAPQIPQAPPTPTVDDLLDEVADEMRGPAPAESVEARFGVRPGQDVGVAPRRGFATSDAPAEKTLLDLSAEAHARLARKATALGMVGDENGTARAAHENAALVQAAIKDGAFDTTGQGQPPQRFNRTDIAGSTRGNGRGRCWSAASTRSR